MKNLSENLPITDLFLVAFVDMTNFAKISLNKESEDIFKMIGNFAFISGECIESRGGTIIKFIGDAALIIFNDADKGVQALVNYKERVDQWLRDEGYNAQLIVKAHYGKATLGYIETGKNRWLDIFGKEVNTTAMISSKGFAITPQVFRMLEPETRKLFKKHTPPITYIGIKEHH